MSNHNQTQKQGSLGRSVLAVLAGLVVGFVLIEGIHLLSSLIYPLPHDLDPKNLEAMKAHAATLPVGAWLWVVAGDTLGTFAGAWLAARVARRGELVHGMIIGCLFLLAGIANLILLPIHPPWFAVVDLSLYPAAAFVAAKCVPVSNRAAQQPATAARN